MTALASDIRWILRIAVGICLGMLAAWGVDDWRTGRAIEMEIDSD